MGTDNRIEVLLDKEILEIQISFEQIGDVDIDFVAFMVDSKKKFHLMIVLYFIIVLINIILMTRNI